MVEINKFLKDAKLIVCVKVSDDKKKVNAVKVTLEIRLCKPSINKILHTKKSQRFFIVFHAKQVANKPITIGAKMR